jgi:hypothetical protein
MLHCDMQMVPEDQLLDSEDEWLATAEVAA